MAFPFARALPILRGISELSGDEVRPVDSDALGPWLEERGEAWTVVGLDNAMRRLREAGYLEAYFRSGGAFGNVRLTMPGRQLVEGWPSSTQVDPAAVASAVVAALQAQADEPDASEEIKGAAKRLSEGAVGAAVNAAVLIAMKQAGLG